MTDDKLPIPPTPRFERVHELSERVQWFDGNGCGPWIKKVHVDAMWIGHPCVMLGPTEDPDPWDLPADPRIFGGMNMRSVDARELAAALIRAADLADAQMTTTAPGGAT